MAIIRPLTSNNRIYLKSRSMGTKNNLTTKDLTKRLGTQPSLKRKRLQSQKMLMYLEVVNSKMIKRLEGIVSTTSQSHREEISRRLALSRTNQSRTYGCRTNRRSEIMRRACSTTIVSSNGQEMTARGTIMGLHRKITPYTSVSHRAE